MKLFIDDIRTPPSDKWHICRDVSSAIRALDLFYQQVDEIMLDHDISHQVIVGGMSRPYPCTETFEAVARYLAKLKKYEDVRQDEHPIWDPVIHIHTSNFVGAERMKDIITEAGFKVDAKVVGGANRLETIL